MGPPIPCLSFSRREEENWPFVTYDDGGLDLRLHGVNAFFCGYGDDVRRDRAPAYGGGPGLGLWISILTWIFHGGSGDGICGGQNGARSGGAGGNAHGCIVRGLGTFPVFGFFGFRGREYQRLLSGLRCPL